jgi:hypothetical protein
MLAISHATVPPGRLCAAKADAIVDLYAQTATPLHLRSRDAITRLLAGFELAPPGLVPVHAWHSEDDGRAAIDIGLLGAAAIKPVPPGTDG